MRLLKVRRRFSAAYMTVTLDKANKLLANNAFPVTVTNNLH